MVPDGAGHGAELVGAPAAVTHDHEWPVADQFGETQIRLVQCFRRGRRDGDRSGMKLPSRLIPAMTRLSCATAWAAVAPPSECPNMPILARSRQWRRPAGSGRRSASG